MTHLERNTLIRLTKLVLLIVLFFSFTAITAQDSYTLNNKTEEYKLDNGFTLILHEDHTSPDVFGYIVVKAGSRNDPADQTGIAHYLEHMLFKGTQELGTTDWEKEKLIDDKIALLFEELRLSKDDDERLNIQKRINKLTIEASKYQIGSEFNYISKSIGCTNVNANTSMDRTVYYSSFAPNQIEKWLDLYSHRFINPVFRQFQPELEVVFEERNTITDQFFIVLVVTYFEHFFKNHPYGQQNIIGEIEHVKNPSLKRMKEYFDTYYVANNMALVLSGDFNSEEIKPMIAEKYGKLRTGVVPEFPEYEVADFKKRELEKERLSPIRINMIGFRTMPDVHPDKTVFTVAEELLTNSSQTGLLDKLKLENKIYEAQLFSWGRKDHGQSIIIAIPKIVGQSLKSSEELVLEQLRKLKDGEFEEWELEAQKKILYKQWMLKFEDNKERGIMLGEAFQKGMTPEDVLDYPNKIKAVTKEDIMRVAKKYYGENYLIMESRMGFRKADKIEQPELEKTNADSKEKSIYRKRIEQITETKYLPKFIDFENDINKTEVKKGIDLYYAKNPKNDAFTLKVRFGVGNDKLPLLKYASHLYNYAGTKEYSVKELKNEFAKIACTYKIISNDSYLTLELKGLDENLTESVTLLNKLINDAEIKQSKVDIIYSEAKKDRKTEKSDLEGFADIVLEYAMYDQKSKYITRLSLDKIKALQVIDLQNTFTEAASYEAEIFYSGTIAQTELSEILKSELHLSENKIKSESPIYKTEKQYTENTVLFVNKKNASQTKLYYYINGDAYKTDDDLNINAFNIYMGGGFAGIILQEIREKRALAYSAYADYNKPVTAHKNCNFIGYAGTQADKTLQLVELFDSLVHNMPEQPERIEFIKKYLELTSFSKKPDFRDLNEQVIEWKNQGFKEDPAKMNADKIKNLQFDEILKFYNASIKNKPSVLILVGNKKRFDFEKLNKYGKVIELDEKILLSKE